MCALDGLGEYAAELTSAREKVVGPLDVRTKRARLFQSVAHGDRRRECNQRPLSRVRARAQDDAEVEPRILRRDPLALATAAPRSLLARDDAQTFARAERSLPRRLGVRRRQ